MSKEQAYSAMTHLAESLADREEEHKPTGSPKQKEDSHGNSTVMKKRNRRSETKAYTV